jgi:hypothetical protein
MKAKIFKYILLLGVLVSTFSCDDLLEEHSYDFVSPEDLGDSEASVNQYIIGTYSALSTELFAYGAYLYLTNMDCDYASGADWAFGNVGAGNPQEFWGINMLWNGSYVLIHRANLGISRISAMTNISDEVKQRGISELSFLKAWAYFNLVRNYGGVPIMRKSVTDGENPHQPRATVPETYEYIIELLKEAEKMPSNKGEQFIEGRVSRGAAKALLAKVYLTMASGALQGAQITVKGGPARVKQGDVWVPIPLPMAKTYTKDVVRGHEGMDATKYFALARDKAWELINDGEYDIFPNYNDIWQISNRNKGEHIWMLQAKSGDEKFGNSICRDYSGIFLSDGTLEGNWYGLRDHWYELFEENDLRVVDGVVHRWSVALGSNGKPAYNYYPKSYESKVNAHEVYDSQGNRYDGTETWRTGTGWSLAKLTKFTYVTDRKVVNGDFHFPILRYADVLLIFAEAENEAENGPTTRAYEQINKIRTRSNAIPFSGMNQQEFRSAVIEERARELSYEADRRYDLFRWGIYLQVMNDIDIDEHNILKRRTERNLLYPIPTHEINANSNINENNPGW